VIGVWRPFGIADTTILGRWQLNVEDCWWLRRML